MDLHQPITVIQLIKKKLIYGKALRAFDLRSKAVTWPETFSSFNGYIQKGTLHLTPTVLEQQNFKQCKCLLLLDELTVNAEELLTGHSSEPDTISSTLLLTDNKHLVKWDVFAFHFQENALSINFEWDYFKVGVPVRENHKLFELSALKSINVLVNGKVDSTLTVGTRRYYQEMEYIFISYGSFSSYEYLNSDIVKQLSYKLDKKIDLMKRLY
jgi:hypothetical protein